MSTAINMETSVAQLLIEQPGLSRVFEKLGIDYCCGGKRSLREACAQKGLDADSVTQTLNAVVAMQDTLGQPQTDWTQASMAGLCDHIEQTHHAYLVEELPRLQFMVDKVARVHGGRHAELHEVQAVFGSLREELSTHTVKENDVVFPLIRTLEADAGSLAPGAVAGPIAELESEHDVAGEHLARLRELTGDYQPPADACGTYRAMLDGLEQLERDTHQHIHKENNILFPRALAQDAARA